MHAYLEFFQVVKLGDLRFGRHGNQLLRVKVGSGKIHRLPALVGDGDGGRHQIAIALRQIVENAFPGRVDKLHFNAGLGSGGPDHVNVKANDLAFFVLRLKRGVGRVGADEVNAGRRCGCRHGRYGRHGGGGWRRWRRFTAGGQKNAGAQADGDACGRFEKVAGGNVCHEENLGYRVNPGTGARTVKGGRSGVEVFEMPEV